MEIFEVVVHLLKCKPQCEEAFRRITWKSSRETFATKRNDLGSISSESGRACEHGGLLGVNQSYSRAMPFFANSFWALSLLESVRTL